MVASKQIENLLAIMAQLRTPGTGCPWDLAQDFRSIAPYAIEEAYETVDAIERDDFEDLPDELGDLLLQVVFHARMAQERGLFDFGDVVESISAKMIRRHPHVFGAETAATPADVEQTWSAIKEREKRARLEARSAAPREPGSAPGREPGFLDGVPVGLPALTRAVKLQQRASKVGFDWNEPRKVLDKIREEIDEVAAELDASNQAALQDEIGDLFFALSNLARHVGVDPEQATRGANAKFERRFGAIERGLAAQNKSLQEASLQEMEALWDSAKRAER